MKCDDFSLADAKVVEAITAAQTGFLGPVNLKNKLKVLADYSVINIINAISGANKQDYHLKNINMHRDYEPDGIADLRKVKKGDICPRCREKELKFVRGIEVGHTFKLGTKYSKSMDASFLDENRNKKHFIMGCYGIGVSRMVAAAIEQSYDENGIIWNRNIAPFNAVIIPINYTGETKDACDKIYTELSKTMDVLLDDRDERAGVKFKDADLIGIPVRITVSEKTLKAGSVEVKYRRESKTELVNMENLLDFIK
jgi:prolyl-tRNA synthetase